MVAPYARSVTAPKMETNNANIKNEKILINMEILTRPDCVKAPA
jgi:hypothetical protein